MDVGWFYLDTTGEHPQVFMVVSRLKFSKRMKIRYQDGFISSAHIDGMGKYLLLGHDYASALKVYPELEYEMKLCMLDDLD